MLLFERPSERQVEKMEQVLHKSDESEANSALTRRQFEQLILGLVERGETKMRRLASPPTGRRAALGAQWLKSAAFSTLARGEIHEANEGAQRPAVGRLQRRPSSDTPPTCSAQDEARPGAQTPQLGAQMERLRVSDCAGRKSARGSAEFGPSSWLDESESESMTNRLSGRRRHDSDYGLHCGEMGAQRDKSWAAREELEPDGRRPDSSQGRPDEDDSTAGPTPTNDLVRGLLRRDRSAWSRAPPASQIRGAQGEEKTIGPSLGAWPPAHNGADNNGGRRARDTQVRDKNLKPEVAAALLDCDDNERPPVRKPRAPRKMGAGSGGATFELCPSLDCRRARRVTIGGGDLAPGSEVSARQAEEGGGAAGREHRGGRVAAALGRLEAGERGQRRHSTYMLPRLLLERASSNASESDDEDLSALSGDGLRPSSSSSSDSGGRAPLPSSASSPSALSTPTNEQLQRRAEADTPALDVGGGRWGALGGGAQVAATQRRVARQELGSEAVGVGRRRRLGSNPLDRLRRASGHTLAAASCALSAGRQANWTQKRHSIINLLSAGRANRPRGAGLESGRRTSESGAGLQQANGAPDQEQLIPESGFKIVVLGTSGSGKTALIQQFLYGTFPARHQPTVEDTYFVEFPHGKSLINISVSDTSGE